MRAFLCAFFEPSEPLVSKSSCKIEREDFLRDDPEPRKRKTFKTVFPSQPNRECGLDQPLIDPRSEFFLHFQVGFSWQMWGI